MKIIRDEIKLCTDCLLAAVNGDTSGISNPDRLAEVNAGLGRLGPHLVPTFDGNSGQGCYEFSWSPCGCCGSKLGGSRHEFAILGE